MTHPPQATPWTPPTTLLPEEIEEVRQEAGNILGRQLEEFAWRRLYADVNAIWSLGHQWCNQYNAGNPPHATDKAKLEIIQVVDRVQTKCDTILTRIHGPAKPETSEGTKGLARIVALAKEAAKETNAHKAELKLEELIYSAAEILRAADWSQPGPERGSLNHLPF